MSDDTRSTHTKQPPRRPRILVVQNQYSDEEGSSGDEPRGRTRHPVAPHASTSHVPAPLTTDLPNQHFYSSSRSNPALSSPSTASSRAAESTPPPDTPGQLAPPVDLTGPGVEQDATSPPVMDRPDVAAPSRMLPKARIEHVRRHSNNRMPAQLQSPTASTHEPEVTTNGVSRSTPTRKVNFLVTQDTETFTAVDITGAITPAFIKERIFTKLGIRDEEQPHYAIYRTEIGSYALSDALTEDQLFQLFREQGDSTASVKLLVWPSSAPIHLPPDPVCLSPVDRTIPPPVLPQYITAPLDVKRHQSGSRRGSQSSQSEHLAPEGNGGYDASVSDDLEFDSRRSTIRPQAPSRIPTSSNHTISPAQYRPHSPLTGPIDGPSLPEPAPPRPDIHHSPSSGVAPAPVQSPQSVSGYSYSQRYGAPSSSYDTIERERAIQAMENQVKEPRRPTRQDREADRATGDRSARRRKTNVNSPEGRHLDGWTLVDPPVSSPSRTPRYGPMSPGYPSILSVPAAPLAAPPVPSSGPRTSKMKQVPAGLVVRWKIPTPTRTHRTPKSIPDLRQVVRDQGSANGHPVSLQPGRPTARPPQGSMHSAPRPSNGSYVVPSMSSATSNSNLVSPFRDSSYHEFGIPRSFDSSRGVQPPASYQSLHNTTSPRSSPGSSGNVGTASSAENQATSRRPRSAEGESGSTLPEQQRPQRGLDDGGAAPSHVHTHSSPSIHVFNSRPELAPLQSGRRKEVQTGGALEIPASGVASRHSSPHSPTRIPRSANISREATSRAVGADAILSNTPLAGQSRRVYGDPGSLLHTEPWRGFIDENETEGTARPSGRTDTHQNQSSQPLPPQVQSLVDAYSNASRREKEQDPATLLPNHLPGLVPVGTMGTAISNIRFAPHDPDGDQDSDEGDGTIWAKPPVAKNKAPAAQARPPLPPLSIENSPSGQSVELPGNSKGERDASLGQSDASANVAQPRPQRRNKSGATVSQNQGQRVSRFEENQSSWASRPPAEVVLDRLEEYFPEHDLDKPLIETQSGGTSPTAAENPLHTPHAYGRKKSIRHVAVEHKQRIDRASRMESSGNLRKRNTRLWGHKLEEVTTEQEQARSLSTPEGSPGGAPKPIFRWVRGELIGKGTYGKVYLALNATTGEMIAVKQVELPRTASDKDDERQVSVVEALKLESETLKDLDHPNIVQYLGFEETANFLSIFLEYVPGGSIASCLRRYGKFEENVTKSFTEQILAGLEYLHSRGILHRDLKADNILVEHDGVCKISDFGISKRTEDINMNAAYTSMQGTVFWMAPEVIDGKKGYNSKIDIWSVGCVVFEMWTGQRPWSGQEAVAVLVKLYQFPQGPPLPDDILLTPLADDFRRQCFAMNPDDRPTAAELRRHKYLDLPPWWHFEGFS